MFRSKAILSLILTALVTVPLYSQTDTGKLSGRLTDAEKNEPLAVATIILFADGEPQFSVRSNQNGNFSFAGVPEGLYQIQVVKRGFRTFEKSIRINPVSVARLVIPMVTEEAAPRTPVQTASNSTPKETNRVVAVPSPAIKPKEEENRLPEGVIESQPVAVLATNNPDSQLLDTDLALVEYPEEAPEPLGGLKAIIREIEYPEPAIRMGIEGKVVVRVTVDKQGDPIRCDILKGANRILNEAAIFTIYKARFKPARHQGQAVVSTINLPVTFSLK